MSGERPSVTGERGSAPLWLRVRSDLERRVSAGEFAEVFPGELALASEYGASRHTIREALRALRRDGVISAARGRTSRVVAPVIEQRLGGALYSIFASVEAAGLRQSSTVIHLDTRTDRSAAEGLQLPATEELVFLERLRVAGAEPLALDRVWLPASFARPLLDVDFSHTSLYEQLRLRCGVRLTGGQERIRAVVLSAAERAALRTPPRVAGLAIDRLGLDAGRPAELRETLVRGDRFSLSANFTPAAYRFDPSTVGGG